MKSQNVEDSVNHRLIAVRTVVLSLSAISLVASLSALYRLQTYRPPIVGGLLFNPGVRFTDLRDIVNAAASGTPYGAKTPGGFTYGPSYPPGAFLFGDAFSHLPTIAPRAALIILTAVAVGAIFSQLLLRSNTTTQKALAFATGTISTLIGASLLDFYALVLPIASAVALATVLLARKNWTLNACFALPLMGGLSFPIIFAIDRLNFDLVVFQLMTVTVILFDRQRNKLAASFFGVAMAVKAYPIYFAFADTRAHGRRTRALIAFGTAAALSAVALANMDYSPREAVAAFQRTSINFEQAYIVGCGGMQYSSSLFTLISILYFKQGHFDWFAFNAHLYALWKPVVAVATILLIATMVIMRFPTWCRLMLLVTALIVLSPASGVYRETILLIPMAMWITSSAHVTSNDCGRRVVNVILGLCLGVALSPLTFFRIFWTEPWLNLTSQSVFGPIAMASVLALALIRGIQDRHRPMY